MAIGLGTTSVGAQTTDITVFGSSLSSSFSDRSTSPRSFSAFAPNSGSPSSHDGTVMSFNPQPWSGLSFVGSDQSISSYGALNFWVNGGASGGQQFTVEVKNGGQLIAGAAVEALVGHPLAPSTWTQVTLPIPERSVLHGLSTFNEVAFYADTSIDRPMVYLDDIVLVHRSGGSDGSGTVPTFPTRSGPCLNRTVRVMPLGDSLTAYPESYRGPLYRTLVSEGWNVDFVGSESRTPTGGGDPDHEGHGGSPIGPGGPGNLADNAPGWIASANPDVIILDIGANDAGARRSLAIAAPKKLAELVKKITDLRPNVIILLGDVPPNGWNLDNFVEQRDINAMAGALGDSSSSDTVIHVPVWPRLRSGWSTSVDTYDNTHFTVSGGQRFASAWLPETRSVLDALRCTGSTAPTTSRATTTTEPPTNPNGSTTLPSPTTLPSMTTTTVASPGGAFALGNQVFNDLNNDGFLGAGESGIGGVTLRLYNNLQPTGASAVTAADGTYAFRNLAASTAYQVCVDPFGSFVGSNGSGITSRVAGDASAHDPNDSVDHDDNAKLQWDGSHCTGHIILDTARSLNNRVDIGLFNPGGTPVTTTVGSTTAPTTSSPTTSSPTTSSPTTSSPTTSTPTTSSPTTSSPPTVPSTTGVGSYTIGNQIFDDLNNNGLFDGNENGISGVTVRLRYNAQPTGRSTVTSASGTYQFGGLAAGTEYQICIDMPSGFTGSTGTSTVPAGSDLTSFDANDSVDNDDNGKYLWDGNHCSSHIVVDALRPANLRVDIGLVRR